MKQSTAYHFPQVRFRNGERLLYNPVLKKTFKDLPEERVRLKLIDYLVYDAGWSRNRIGVEAPVKLPQSVRPLRADLILFKDDMTPHTVAECKAESVSITQKAATQIARYNTEVNADYILLTNGASEYWFDVRDGSPEPTPPPVPGGVSNVNYRDEAEYWQKRGFISAASKAGIKEWAKEQLQQLFDIERGEPVVYLSPAPPEAEYIATGYYRLFNTADDEKLAVTILDDGKSVTRLVAMLNKNGRNHGMVSINPEQKTGTLYTPEKTVRLEVEDLSGMDTVKPQSPDRFIKNLRAHFG